MLNATVNVNLNAPELVGAILQLAEALAGRPAPLPIVNVVNKAEKPQVEAVTVAAEAAVELPRASFEEVHAALVKLKQQKSAAQVRAILEAVGCKTVQDIPPEKFAPVLQMAADKLVA